MYEILKKEKKTFIYIGIMILGIMLYALKGFSSMPALNFVVNILALIALIGFVHTNIKETLYKDKATYALICIGVIINLALGSYLSHNNGSYYFLKHRFFHSIGGFICGGVGFYLYAMFGKSIFKQDVIGGGDIKLAAGLGAFVGPIVIWMVPVWVCAIFLLMRIKRMQSSTIPSILIHYRSSPYFLVL
jgi:prepilin signal peptidase PulO-like enzyme (type II secretory pathway)